MINYTSHLVRGGGAPCVSNQCRAPRCGVVPGSFVSKSISRQHGAKQLSERIAFIPPRSTSALLDGPVPLLPQLLRQREGQRGLHASRRALVHRRPLPHAAPPRVGRHGRARLHVRGGDSPELTRSPRGLRRARTGYACQPPGYCTYMRRRAACPQGRHAATGYQPRAYGAYRGPSVAPRSSRSCCGSCTTRSTRTASSAAARAAPPTSPLLRRLRADIGALALA